MVPRILTVAALGLVLGACDFAIDAESDRVDEDRNQEVAGDDGATAAEVIDAGYPIAADRSGDGSLLIVYYTNGEDDEVYQAAWRLYDADGATVAERKFDSGAEEFVIGLDEGFFHESDGIGEASIIGADGSVAEAPDVGRRAVRSDDRTVGLFGDRGVSTVTGETFIPIPRQGRGSQGLAIDGAGRMWSQRVSGDRAYELYVAESGGDWRRVRSLELGNRQHAMGFGVTAVGEHLVLPVVKDATGGEVIHKVAVRRTAAAPGAPWQYLDPGPAGDRHWAFGHPVGAADDHTFLIADLRRGTLALDLETGAWSEVEHPTGEEFWAVRVGRGGLYAFHNDHADARFSADLGATWEALPH